MPDLDDRERDMILDRYESSMRTARSYLRSALEEIDMQLESVADLRKQARRPKRHPGLETRSSDWKAG